MSTIETPDLDVISDLPTLPSVVSRVLELVLDEDTSVQELSEVIEADQALSSRVLKIVNSAAYGLSEKVSTIHHAVALLGPEAIKDLVISISVYDEYLDESGEEYGLDKTFFWQHCLATASAARELAREWDFDVVEEAYGAGLLHDIGKVVFEKLDRFDYAAVIEEVKEGIEPHLAVERNHFEVDHAEMGARVLEHWHMPGILVDAIGHHHANYAELQGLPRQHRALAQIVQVADFICWTQGYGSIEGHTPPVIDSEIQEDVNLDDVPVERITEAIEREIQRMTDVFEFDVPSPDRFRQALQKANMKLGRINSLYEEAKNELEQRVKELTELNKTMRQARQLEPDGVRSKVLDATQGLGFDRSAYFTLDKEEKRATGVEIRDKTNMSWDPEEIEVTFDDGDELIEAFEEDGKPVVFESRSNPIAEALMDCFEVSQIGVAPVLVQDELNGLLVVDNVFSGRDFRDTSLESFELLASEAGVAMEKALLFEETKRLAIRDDLTDLFNRRECLKRLEKEMERVSRYDRSLSVAMMDLDHFKQLNDTYGHLAGDEILDEIANVLREESRDVDILGRYGGEEFLAVLPETEKDQAIVYGERIRKAVEQRGKERKSEFPEYDLTISIGIVEYNPDEEETPEDLLQKADNALYAAKNRGRNRVVSGP